MCDRTQASEAGSERHLAFIERLSRLDHHHPEWFEALAGLSALRAVDLWAARGRRPLQEPGRYDDDDDGDDDESCEPWRGSTHDRDGFETQDDGQAIVGAFRHALNLLSRYAGHSTRVESLLRDLLRELITPRDTGASVVCSLVMWYGDLLREGAVWSRAAAVYRGVIEHASEPHEAALTSAAQRRLTACESEEPSAHK